MENSYKEELIDMLLCYFRLKENGTCTYDLICSPTSTWKGKYGNQPLKVIDIVFLQRNHSQKEQNATKHVKFPW